MHGGQYWKQKSWSESSNLNSPSHFHWSYWKMRKSYSWSELWSSCRVWLQKASRTRGLYSICSIRRLGKLRRARQSGQCRTAGTLRPKRHKWFSSCDGCHGLWDVVIEKGWLMTLTWKRIHEPVSKSSSSQWFQSAGELQWARTWRRESDRRWEGRHTDTRRWVFERAAEKSDYLIGSRTHRLPSNGCRNENSIQKSASMIGKNVLKDSDDRVDTRRHVLWGAITAVLWIMRWNIDGGARSGIGPNQRVAKRRREVFYTGEEEWREPERGRDTEKRRSSRRCSLVAMGDKREIQKTCLLRTKNTKKIN